MFRKILLALCLSLGTLLMCPARSAQSIQPTPTAQPARSAQPAQPAESAAAADRALRIVERLAAEFRAMRSYGVRFEVAAGEYVTRGSYSVEGDRYCLTVGDAEVFSDGRTRYEVDNRRREVTINPVDSASRNILSNPVRAFDFLGDTYAPALLWERDGRASVRLRPAEGGDAATGEITVTVTTEPVRPVSLMYDYDGEHVGVAILSVAPLGASLPTFDKDRYSGYEFIDFR